MARGRPLLNLRLDPADLAALTAEAERRGVTRSDLVRDLLAPVLDEHRTDQAEAEGVPSAA